MRSKIVNIVIVLILSVIILLLTVKNIIPNTSPINLLGKGRVSLRLWYTDESLSDYLTTQAVKYNEAHSNVRIEPILVSGVELLENINSSSLKGEAFPDLYITTNDVLEKASLAGLTTEIAPDGRYLNENNFSKAALNSISYKGNYVAYPFYYETSALMFNRTYLEDFAWSRIAENEGISLSYEEASEDESEADKEKDGETASNDNPEENKNEDTKEDDSEKKAAFDANIAELRQQHKDAIDLAVQEMIPSTISEIIEFARNYNAPASVESVFEWDVTDIFYNYFFVGGYINAGGDAGDTITELDLYTTEMVSCMMAYQKLRDYFAIDANEVSYSGIMEDFIAGKMVFTVATSDAVTKIRAAQAEGSCSFQYGVANIPDLNEDYITRSMSVTGCIAVNGYTNNTAEAFDFAGYLSSGTDESFFNQTGKLPARKGIEYGDRTLEIFEKVYEESVPLPKMIETSNLWMLMEIAFTEIWNGANPNTTLKEMSESIMKQVVGRHYEEMLLPEPEAVQITNSHNAD